jgi:hypothetical protein
MATTEAAGRAGRVRVEQGAKRLRAYLGGELVADTIRPRLVWRSPTTPPTTSRWPTCGPTRWLRPPPSPTPPAAATPSTSPSRPAARPPRMRPCGMPTPRSPNSATSSGAGPTSHPVEPGDLPAGQPNRSRPAVEVSVGFMHHRRSRRFRLLGSNRVSPGRSSVVGGPPTWRSVGRSSAVMRSSTAVRPWLSEERAARSANTLVRGMTPRAAQRKPRPHPHPQSRAHRHADQGFRRSCSTVRSKVMRSRGRLRCWLMLEASPTIPGSFLRLEHLPDLELALGAVLAGVDPGKRLERETFGPFDGLVQRLHLRIQ